jgi:uncharacterized repeat protein (TIGR03837 family)
MHWDLFCRVVDNYGDIGVCWRLAADLAARGENVRLWVNDAGALAWMAPRGATGVEVRAWPADDDAHVEPHEVVIEAFGCHLPTGFLTRMGAKRPAPTWVNLEYLSAESYVERSHGLPSPQASGPAQGLDKWFFYPGFTEKTGGLLRERDLVQRQTAFDAGASRARVEAASALQAGIPASRPTPDPRQSRSEASRESHGAAAIDAMAASVVPPATM